MLTLLIQLLKDVWQKLGFKVLALCLLMVLGGLLDGMGMVMLLPLLNLIGVTTSQAGFAQLFAENFFSTIGIPLNLNSVLLFIILIFSIQASLVISQGWLIARAETSYVNEWRSRLMALFFNASWPFFVKNKLGSLVYLIIIQTEKAGRAFFGFLELIAVIIMATIYLIISFLVSSKFTLALGTVSILTTAFFFLPFVKRSYGAGAGYSKYLDEMQTVSTDYISGAKLIKATGTEQTALKKLGEVSKKVDIEYFNSTFFPYALRATAEFLAIIILCGFLYIGVKYLAVQAGVVLVLLAIFFRLVPRLYHAYSSLQNLGKLLPSFGQIDFYQSNALDLSEGKEEKNIVPHNFSETPDISIQNLSINYDEKTVLSNISLFIPRYEKLGVIGESGAGKSTLADCILGLAKSTNGRILINDSPLEEISMHEWRRSIGYVTQETILFNDTVKANILWGYEEASNSKLIDAAKKAHAHDFIQALPNGYETMVGDKGVCLSGGQRQRLALARALLGCPVILILDEATSALDSASEREVLDALNGLDKQVTSIMISHRLSSLKDADKILILDNGKVVDQGAWDDLALRSEQFSQMLKLQRD